MFRTDLTLRRPLVAVVASVALLLAAGCSDDDSSVPTDSVAAEVVTEATSVKVSPQEGAALIESMGDSLTIIDVRTAEEFAAGHLEGAINIDIEGGQFSARIEGMDHDAAYLVYCHSGRRSALATETLVAAGFTQVHDLGGIVDWQAAGLPVVTD